MSEDDEVTSWIGSAGSKIRTSGQLSESEVANAVVAYLKNGTSLLSDARFLAGGGRFERGIALTVLAMEELAKIKIIFNTFLNHAHGSDLDVWKEYWKTGGSHKIKQEHILSYGKGIRELFDGRPTQGKYLYRYYAPDAAFANLDWFKQSNLYVDIREDGIHEPDAKPDSVKAMDYLLTFAQERADSFMAWHISTQRTLDQLKVATGRGDAKRWTSSYRPAEVFSDLLYQVIYFSASEVPDYELFRAFIRAYLQKRVSEKRVKEALLNLADEICLRIDGSHELPFFQSRHIGASKLIRGVAKNSNIFPASFNRDLLERLSLDGRKG